MITSGASCPDAVVEEVMEKLLKLFPGSTSIDAVVDAFQH